MTEEEYDKKCEKIQKENKELLDLFRKDLNGLSEKTIERHIENVDFYINDYLIDNAGGEEPSSFEEGIGSVDDFFGWYFIRNCLWSSPSSIKTTAASIKKFYQCMLKHHKIDQEDYDALCENIKDGMPKWIETCRAFNDPDADDPYSDFF